MIASRSGEPRSASHHRIHDTSLAQGASHESSHRPPPFLADVFPGGLRSLVPGAWAVGQSRSPNEKLNFACIGVGGKGSGDTDHVAGLGNIVALCDIDSDRLGKKAERHAEAKTYSDFRKLLEELAPRSTPWS